MGKGAQKSDIIVDYLPPHVQKGIPYHRYAMVVFKQPKYIKPKSIIGKLVNRDTFNMRSFQAKLKLEAIGAFMWRNEFDSGTKQVMERHNIPGADVMWQRTKI